MISAIDKVENFEGKEANAGYHHFLLFPQCFKCSLFMVDKTRDCVDLVKSKALADSKINVTNTLKYVSGRV